MLPKATLRKWVDLIEMDFSAMTPEEKLKMALAHCEYYYDTETETFYDGNGNAMDEADGLRRTSFPNLYLAFGLNKDENLIDNWIHFKDTGGKSMSTSRVNNYASLYAPMISRLCGDDGKAPDKIIWISMGVLESLGTSFEEHLFPNLRNQIVEEDEAVLLKIFRPTIEGHGSFGDVRTMSKDELSERGKRLYKKYGFQVFGWDNSQWSTMLFGGGKGGKGGKPRNTPGDGSSKRFLDLSDPSQLAQFEFCCVDGTERTGTLYWQLQRKGLDENGNVYYYLVNQEDEGKKSVDLKKSIYYCPLDGEPIEIDVKKFFPKPSPWICIKGIDKKLTPEDIKVELKRNLKQGETRK